MSNPWKEYKKGVNYLKKNGLMVFIKMPPGGKTEWLQASPGLIMQDKVKETLQVPMAMNASAGKVFQISKEFMERFKLITELDLHRIIRNCSIILTNFSGPRNEDIVSNHLDRLQKWKAEDKKLKQTEFVGSLIMLENLHESKDLLPNNHYKEAATIIGYMFKLW